MKRKKKHPGDETMVIAVMIVSALCILILLASYMSTVGEAYSIIPSKGGIYNMISGATVVEGNGKTTCSIKCREVGQTCIVAHGNDLLVKCGSKITGSYSCLCSTTQKIVGVLPS